MILNNVVARDMADFLLEIKAVILNAADPFTWASGIKSPIYCDNRKTLSHPKVRNFIKTSFADLIDDEFGDTDVIAGVATAGIPHGALVADVLNLPFVYVRDKPKGHGLENQIEGKLEPGQRVFVIEDLISTGGSSLKAVDALRAAGAEVVGLGAIFTYGFPQAETAFKEANCKAVTLTNYDTLLDIALRNNYIKQSELDTLKAWKENPQGWNK
ncbi:MAG: orotate phosphoribosyltransferase [Chitinophagales bacterium]|nr:orotate phosphoribosyltransferase [Chitinophagales bacterium]